MTYQLYLGDPTYSSWSMRGWILFDRFNISAECHWVDFLSGSVAEQMKVLPPSRTVPSLRTPDGAVAWDSLAIAEELATRHSEAGLWPQDPGARATARSLAAEMHSGFPHLRNDCPMNLRVAYVGVPTSPELEAELRRLELLWEFARSAHAADSPWLCGAYTIADAFFAPIAARIAGYGLEVSDSAAAYVAAHLADPSFRRWRSIAQARGNVLSRYDRPYERCNWPGSSTLPARAIADGMAENTSCPFSGKPVTDLAEIEGRIIGFCNPFCRDKVVADAAVWPEVMGAMGR